MKFKFENLGYIDKGEITPGNLTIIAGTNNIGKTYINYAIYSFLENLIKTNTIKVENQKIDELNKTGFTKIDLNYHIKDIDSIIKKFSEEFSKKIAYYFNTNEENFSKTKIDFEFKEFNCELDDEFIVNILIGQNDTVKSFKNKNSPIIEYYLNKVSDNQIPDGLLSDILSRTISSVLFKKLIKRPFIITSERTGISLFYKELDFTKSRILDLFSKEKKPNLFEILDTYRAKYAEPIKENIDIIRDFENIQKFKSFIVKNHKEEFTNISNKFTKILNGSYKFINNQIQFQTKPEKGRKAIKIPLYITSSAIKSLYLFDLYVKSIARPNDILMIDEPELNLHPTNQIIMARILANIVNLGVDVIIITHSDYIIKEFNNLIMLSNDFSEKMRIIKSNKYDQMDILKPEKVKAYFIEKHQIFEAKVDSIGINLKLFDDTINNINRISDDIYYSLGS